MVRRKREMTTNSLIKVLSILFKGNMKRKKGTKDALS